MCRIELRHKIIKERILVEDPELATSVERLRAGPFHRAAAVPVAQLRQQHALARYRTLCVPQFQAHYPCYVLKSRGPDWSSQGQEHPQYILDDGLHSGFGVGEEAETRLGVCDGVLRLAVDRFGDLTRGLAPGEGQLRAGPVHARLRLSELGFRLVTKETSPRLRAAL